MTRIKICGITNEGDIVLCAALGTDALGFVVEYPKDVPWNLERTKALSLMDRVPPFVSRTIVVGGGLEHTVELVEYLNPHTVQLHGDEPLGETSRIVEILKRRHVTVIKAIRVDADGSIRGDMKDPVEASVRLKEAGVDALLMDSFSRDRAGGTGRTFDWQIARDMKQAVDIPLIMAGGLNAVNVKDAINAVHPYGVDVISGVESETGKKDYMKLKAFVDAVRETGTTVFE